MNNKREVLQIDLNKSEIPGCLVLIQTLVWKTAMFIVYYTYLAILYQLYHNTFCLGSMYLVWQIDMDQYK